jgi:hypothetical protein
LSFMNSPIMRGACMPAVFIQMRGSAHRSESVMEYLPGCGVPTAFRENS